MFWTRSVWGLGRVSGMCLAWFALLGDCFIPLVLLKGLKVVSQAAILVWEKMAFLWRSLILLVSTLSWLQFGTYSLANPSYDDFQQERNEQETGGLSFDGFVRCPSSVVDFLVVCLVWPALECLRLEKAKIKGSCSCAFWETKPEKPHLIVLATAWEDDSTARALQSVYDSTSNREALQLTAVGSVASTQTAVRKLF